MSAIEDAAECPSCGATAQPEQDGDVTYWSCGCGYDWGYQAVPSTDPSCQLGIPEETRRFASGGIIPADQVPTGDRVPVWLTQHPVIPRRPDVPS